MPKKSRNEDLTSAPQQPESTAGTLAARIIEHRNRKGFATVSDLWREVQRVDPERKGIARSTLTQYEHGDFLPGARELRLLCDALNVTPNVLLYGKAHPFDKPEHGLSFVVSTTDKDLRAFVIGTLLAALDEDRLNTYAKMLEDSLRAKLKPDDFVKLLAGAQVMVEQFQTMGLATMAEGLTQAILTSEEQQAALESKFEAKLEVLRKAEGIEPSSASSTKTRTKKKS